MNMGHGAWDMGHRPWGMEHEAWGMGHGARGMGHKAWGMEHGAWGMGHGAWGMEVCVGVSRSHLGSSRRVPLRVPRSPIICDLRTRACIIGYDTRTRGMGFGAWGMGDGAWGMEHET